MGLRGAGTNLKLQADHDPGIKPPDWTKEKDPLEQIFSFVESLPITKGIYAGRSMELLPGQREFIRQIYGRKKRDGTRQVRLAIKSEPRGNGKTGLLAGLALCHLFGPEAEPRGEIYSCAYNKLQAALIFEEMKAIIEALPAGHVPKCNIRRGGKIIEILDGNAAGSFYESLSADDRRAHGLSPTMWIYDEFAQAPNADLLDNLRTAMGKRAESLGVVISTQAANDQHPLSKMIDDAKLGVDPSIYLQLKCAPPDADIFKEKTWRACNEALGKFLSLAEFRDQARSAERSSSFRAKFRNLRLNQRIDATTQFIGDDDWMVCKGKLDFTELRGKPCYAGLDLSTVIDMSALVLYWPHNGSVLPFFWLPEEGLHERDKKERGHYREWKDADLIETTPGRAINYKAIIRRLSEIKQHYDLRAIAYDPWNITQFTSQCEDENIKLPLVKFGQGYKSMAPAVKMLEEAVKNETIRHGGHPILRWQMANAAVESDPAANRKITKKRSSGHVDGVVAMLMAMGVSRMVARPVTPFLLT
jgi:phage terminase large subunit-like protein